MAYIGTSCGYACQPRSVTYIFVRSFREAANCCHNLYQSTPRNGLVLHIVIFLNILRCILPLRACATVVMYDLVLFLGCALPVVAIYTNLCREMGWLHISWFFKSFGTSCGYACQPRSVTYIFVRSFREAANCCRNLHQSTPRNGFMAY